MRMLGTFRDRPTLLFVPTLLTPRFLTVLLPAGQPRLALGAGFFSQIALCPPIHHWPSFSYICVFSGWDIFTNRKKSFIFSYYFLYFSPKKHQQPPRYILIISNPMKLDTVKLFFPNEELTECMGTEMDEYSKSLMDSVIRL